MNVGIIGLGRMGSGVAARLLETGHTVSVHNRTHEKSEGMAILGAIPAKTVDDFLASLPAPRIVWLYLPSGETTLQYIEELEEKLSPGDILIDGGNSHFESTISNGARLAAKGIHFIDVGTSGGVAGKVNGYCLMIGGEKEIVERCNPLWEAISQTNGFSHVGPVGAGHYVKMIHNAIEYGMMQAYGEGMAVLANSRFKDDLDLEKVTGVWQHGSIIRSYLGELLWESMKESPTLETIGEKIDDNGEGKWAIEEAIDLGIATPVITASLYARYLSRGTHAFSNKVVAMLRNKFGGHAVQSVKSE
jgi:6-phosphogluconate dehydrogenase